MTLSGLLFAGADVCVLETFGMKMNMLKKLAEKQVDEPSLEERVDIGISAYCSGIPLFTCTNRGKVHPLLFMAGFGNGSITVESELNSNTKVRTVVYPKLSHHIKSLLHISYDVSRTTASSRGGASSSAQDAYHYLLQELQKANGLNSILASFARHLVEYAID